MILHSSHNRVPQRPVEATLTKLGKVDPVCCKDLCLSTEDTSVTPEWDRWMGFQ
ncbi:hypothetical protein DPMN_083692 [Dreissena polymorpha]|uniref:Uncharacterized protein n=1 Tax=Dreissena polymorpha TaxID=45954 RepID=A0A9D3YD60_DREPO|nr:hypothetical protein DPMN_083692 [Dreissena polymorpha]